jgi:hypothetical protein
LLSHFDDIRSTMNDGTLFRAPSQAEEGSMPRHLVDPDDPEGRRNSILLLDNPDRHARAHLRIVTENGLHQRSGPLNLNQSRGS